MLQGIFTQPDQYASELGMYASELLSRHGLGALMSMGAENAFMSKLAEGTNAQIAAEGAATSAALKKVVDSKKVSEQAMMAASKKKPASAVAKASDQISQSGSIGTNSTGSIGGIDPMSLLLAKTTLLGG
jgi:hypothetical protein